MSALRIRLYNVLFGDAILVSVPRPGGKAHILFDVGNVLNQSGGSDDVFEPIMDDIIRETGGEVDLYVMTHEHLDHVQGLLHASETWGKSIKAKKVWITASAEPNYYATHPKAEKQKKSLAVAYAAAERIMQMRGAAYAGFTSLLANNITRDTSKCVDYLCTKVARKKSDVHFISRNDDGRIDQPIPTVKFEILAPEEDTADYYGRGKPFAIGAIGEAVDAGAGAASQTIAPPPGVDAGAFADLLKSREEGFLNTLLQIDKAANNTSVVLRMNWKGRTLLFPGDAENKSWAFIKKNGALGPVDFLKLGHHGSHNGMPLDLLDTLLPQTDTRKRYVGLSTCVGCYNNVPLPSLLKQIGARAEIYDTRDVKPGNYVDVSLSALT